jgi:hypothetical protein
MSSFLGCVYITADGVNNLKVSCSRNCRCICVCITADLINKCISDSRRAYFCWQLMKIKWSVATFGIICECIIKSTFKSVSAVENIFIRLTKIAGACCCVFFRFSKDLAATSPVSDTDGDGDLARYFDCTTVNVLLYWDILIALLWISPLQRYFPCTSINISSLEIALFAYLLSWDILIELLWISPLLLCILIAFRAYLLSWDILIALLWISPLLRYFHCTTMNISSISFCFCSPSRVKAVHYNLQLSGLHLKSATFEKLVPLLTGQLHKCLVILDLYTLYSN